jgi:hypothetical protein
MYHESSATEARSPRGGVIYLAEPPVSSRQGRRGAAIRDIVQSSAQARGGSMPSGIDAREQT